MTEQFIKRRERFGAYYNWPAVTNSSFAPDGWRVALLSDFETLFSYASTDVVAKLRAEYLWNPLYPKYDTFGFSLLGSSRRAADGIFANYAHHGVYLWTGNKIPMAVPFALIYAIYDVSEFTIVTSNADYWKPSGICVRLVKNNTDGYPLNGSVGTLMDVDGNGYKAIRIGDQVWLAENWKATKLNDGTSIQLLSGDANWAGQIGAAMCYFRDNITFC